jgi:CelD/BcsL family acetyltransferase involved in cellulose biosynthesis
MWDPNYTIIIYNDINDTELKSAWINLQLTTEIYPQMYYEWIESWWRIRGGKKNHEFLHIIVVKDHNGEILGIAPLCLIKNLGLKILKSIPLHFGDFYHFIVKSDDLSVINHIIEYCYSFKDWQVVEFNQVNNTNKLFEKLKSKKIHSKHLSDLVYTNVDYSSFELFLNSINKKQRKEYLRRERRLGERGELTLEVIKTQEGYNRYENAMKSIYLKRWGYEDNNSLKEIFKYRKEAYGKLLDKGKALGFVLLLNNTPIAYRLGFKFETNFVSWKLVYDIKYQRYGVGVITSMKVFQYLIENDFTSVNNGVGEYDYKANWFNNEVRNTNYAIFLRNRNPWAIGYVYFQSQLKEKIKGYMQRTQK